MVICFCGRTLLTFQDWDLLNDSRHDRGHVALADISTSTFTNLKQLYCNRIFTDKAELALNSDSDGLYLRRFRDDFKTVKKKKLKRLWRPTPTRHARLILKSTVPPKRPVHRHGN